MMSLVSWSELPADGLDARAIMRDAAEEAGWDDFGDAGYVTAFERYCAGALEANLEAQGVAGQISILRRLLVNHLRMQRDLSEHPEILEERIVAPIVICGLPRTGSSKLQRLLSHDPNAHALASWRALNPAPFPGWQRDTIDARIAEADAHFTAIEQLVPEFMAIHPTETHEADEDVWLLHMSFRNLSNAILIDAPDYLRAIQRSGHQDDYVYERRLLQYLQWQESPGQPRSWVLKSPVHSGRLPDILDIYPDATLVQCHRNLDSVMGSVCRMWELLWALVGHGSVDPVDLGAKMLEIWSTELRRGLEQRQTLDRPLVDVRYDDMIQKPLTVVADIYSSSDRRLAPETEKLMGSWERESNHKQRRHMYRYDLETYGLTSQQIVDSFGPYATYLEDLME